MFQGISNFTDFLMLVSKLPVEEVTKFLDKYKTDLENYEQVSFERACQIKEEFQKLVDEYQKTDDSNVIFTGQNGVELIDLGDNKQLVIRNGTVDDLADAILSDLSSEDTDVVLNALNTHALILRRELKSN